MSNNVYNIIASAVKVDPSSTRLIRPSIFDAEFFFPGVGEGEEVPPEPEPEAPLEAVDLPVMDAFRAAESELNSAKAASGSVICGNPNISTQLSKREIARNVRSAVG